jgi:hypothetical protein
LRTAILLLPIILTSAFAADRAIALPVLRTSLQVDDQTVAIAVSGSVDRIPADQGRSAFEMNLRADLRDLQEHITPILRAELNRDERCGDRLAIEQAALAPAAPAGSLTTSLHYEKWVCVKAFHKDLVKRLAGGNGTVQVQLTPRAIDGKTLRLEATLGDIQADGSIAELLRSPDFAEKLREKLAKALDKVNLQETIPPAVRGMASIEEANFADAGNGRLALQVRAKVSVPAAEANALLDRLSGK